MQKESSQRSGEEEKERIFASLSGKESLSISVGGSVFGQNRSSPPMSQVCGDKTSLKFRGNFFY